jgi:hypothetical protein
MTPPSLAAVSDGGTVNAGCKLPSFFQWSHQSSSLLPDDNGLICPFVTMPTYAKVVATFPGAAQIAASQGASIIGLPAGSALAGPGSTAYDKCR